MRLEDTAHCGRGWQPTGRGETMCHFEPPMSLVNVLRPAHMYGAPAGCQALFWVLGTQKWRQAKIPMGAVERA